jgi:hypothetical protein
MPIVGVMVCPDCKGDCRSDGNLRCRGNGQIPVRTGTPIAPRSTGDRVPRFGT